MSRGEELIKNTIIITIGKIATQFVSFILLPLYTTMLTTVEYGTVDLFTTYIQLLLPLVTLLIEQGAFRFLLECEKNEFKKKIIITNSCLLIIFQCLLYSILFIVLSSYIKNAFKYYVLIILIVSSFSGWALQIARGFRNLTIYALGSFLATFISILFNVLFIVVFKMGVKGMLIATIISNIGCFFYIFIKLKLHKYFDMIIIDRTIARDMIKYSVPLIPNQLSLWIINSSDRSIVNLFLGTAANGILAVSHKFSSIYSTIFGMFQLSWHEMGAVHLNDDDGDEFFTDMFAQAYRFFSAMCIGLVAIIPFIFPLLIKKSFAEAYYTIPIYLVAVLCNISVGLLGVVYVAMKNTSEIAKSTIYSGIINLLVHLGLIKFFGLYAAAISTYLSYFCIMVYRMIDTQKYIKIKYEYHIYLISSILVILVMIPYYINNLVLRLLGLLIALLYAILVNRKLVNIIVLKLKEVINIKRCK